MDLLAPQDAGDPRAARRGVRRRAGGRLCSSGRAAGRSRISAGVAVRGRHPLRRWAQPRHRRVARPRPCHWAAADRRRARDLGAVDGVCHPAARSPAGNRAAVRCGPHRHGTDCHHPAAEAHPTDCPGRVGGQVGGHRQRSRRRHPRGVGLRSPHRRRARSGSQHGRARHDERRGRGDADRSGCSQCRRPTHVPALAAGLPRESRGARPGIHGLCRREPSPAGIRTARGHCDGIGPRLAEARQRSRHRRVQREPPRVADRGVVHHPRSAPAAHRPRLLRDGEHRVLPRAGAGGPPGRRARVHMGLLAELARAYIHRGHGAARDRRRRRV